MSNGEKGPGEYLDPREAYRRAVKEAQQCSWYFLQSRFSAIYRHPNYGSGLREKN